MSLLTEDYDYPLPESLIASHPLAARAASRMMVLDRVEQRIEHRQFQDFAVLFCGDGDSRRVERHASDPCARVFR